MRVKKVGNIISLAMKIFLSAYRPVKYAEFVVASRYHIAELIGYNIISVFEIA